MYEENNRDGGGFDLSRGWHIHVQVQAILRLVAGEGISFSMQWSIWCDGGGEDVNVYDDDENDVGDDKFYNEEKDPDYVLPGSDLDVETEDDEEDPEELSQLQKEAWDDLPVEILEGKYK